uniref:Putative trypsin-like serine protease n=1 Tax=Rhipicephalus microplus TaxID=6941 RepID=A0A6G4ZZ80_RHIMP
MGGVSSNAVSLRSICLRRHHHHKAPRLECGPLLFVNNEYAQKVTVSYGSVDRHSGKKVDASKVLIHKHFDNLTASNDIALLEVKYPFQFSKDVAPICLPTTPVKLVNKDAVVAGWGSLYLGGTRRRLPSSHNGHIFCLTRYAV